MKDETGKIILLIASDVILILITLLVHYFVMKNNISDAQAAVIHNDGPTTILIYSKTDWKIVVLYFLFTTTINVIIMSIIRIIEYKKIINVPLKYKIIIIIAFAILTKIFLFPGLGAAIKIKGGAEARASAAAEDGERPCGGV